ncbi:hypothetical protein ACIBF5_09875 [Micromonospora sp. NPDC050417]|uniref:hypothetical protein n=1 Tax=Micromonospora sp. NPDC050417 TaxID=3364280 RepID=UPI00379122DA
MTAKHTQCRYLRRNDQQCSAEVADESAEILLCVKHLARAMALVKAATGRNAR